MADTSHSDTPEYVAYRLLQHVADIEQKPISGSDATRTGRKWLLDTYAECLEAVKEPGIRLQRSSPGA